MQLGPSATQVVKSSARRWQRKLVGVPPLALGAAEGGRQVVGFYWCGEESVCGVAAPVVREITYVDDSGESCDCKHGVSGMQQALQAGPHAATYEQENNVSEFRRLTHNKSHSRRLRDRLSHYSYSRSGYGAELSTVE